MTDSSQLFTPLVHACSIINMLPFHVSFSTWMIILSSYRSSARRSVRRDRHWARTTLALHSKPRIRYRPSLLLLYTIPKSRKRTWDLNLVSKFLGNNRSMYGDP